MILNGEETSSIEAPAGHARVGVHAWVGIKVDLAYGVGVLCVADALPRIFEASDIAVIEAIGSEPRHGADGKDSSAPTLEALLRLSGRLLETSRDATPLLGRGDMLAAADRLDEVARHMRELAAPTPSTVIDTATTAEDPCKRATPLVASNGGTRILLADDLDLNRKLIADLLSLEGHDVDCVADGAAAVRAVAATRYDLVLMDMVMPEMDGLAATRAIRALNGPTRDVPIVALTANAFPDQLNDCLKAGMDAAVTKPISVDSLAEVVAHWTRGRHAAE